MGAPLPVGTVVEERDLPSYIAGLVITNDVSARDVQLTKTQFYERQVVPDLHPDRAAPGAAGAGGLRSISSTCA